MPLSLTKTASRTFSKVQSTGDIPDEIWMVIIPKKSVKASRVFQII